MGYSCGHGAVLHVTCWAQRISPSFRLIRPGNGTDAFCTAHAELRPGESGGASRGTVGHGVVAAADEYLRANLGGRFLCGRSKFIGPPRPAEFEPTSERLVIGIDATPSAIDTLSSTVDSSPLRKCAIRLGAGSCAIAPASTASGSNVSVLASGKTTVDEREGGTSRARATVPTDAAADRDVMGAGAAAV